MVAPLEQIGNNCKENATKFMGIYLDEHLTWKHHVNQLNKKVSKALFSIKQVKYVLPTDPLFKASKILKLSDLFEYQSALFMYDYLHSALPESFDNMFIKNNQLPNSRTTRQSNVLHLARLPKFTFVTNMGISGSGSHKELTDTNR